MAEKSKYEAGVQFAKLQRAQDAQKATAEYEAAAQEQRAKTARLKALRLARDATAAKTAPAAANSKKKKAKPAALSDWLDGEAKGGRRS